jgi:hypothetical protein
MRHAAIEQRVRPERGPKLAGIVAVGLCAALCACAGTTVRSPQPEGPGAAAQPTAPSSAQPASRSPSGAPTAPAEAPSFAAEPGLYRCELDRKVTVRRIAPDRQSLVLNWQGQDHPMRAVNARTGALRYESPQSGLTWLVIAGKSMLLDSRGGRQLANECKL